MADTHGTGDMYVPEQTNNGFPMPQSWYAAGTACPTVEECAAIRDWLNTPVKGVITGKWQMDDEMQTWIDSIPETE